MQTMTMGMIKLGLQENTEFRLENCYEYLLSRAVAIEYKGDAIIKTNN